MSPHNSFVVLRQSSHSFKAQHSANWAHSCRSLRLHKELPPNRNARGGYAEKVTLAASAAKSPFSKVALAVK